MTAPHAHSHPHGAHSHVHGPGTPHPAQSPPWSVLRMTALGRLGAALLATIALWAIVLTAMR